ncbi:MAG: LysM peptidoglycan-binding domain-containing protein [Lentisphaeria bacterium]|nr:LysM peptidoglycan-binding domain-containing protein [Lentisphaeria bacterium]
MNKKSNLFLTAAICGLTALTAGCSPNWVAGDPPEDFYLENPVPVPEVKPEVKPVVEPVAAKPEVKPEVKPEAKPELKPVLKPDENIPTTPDIVYTVQKGETLADLTRIFGVAEKDIASRNGLAVTAKLTAGQTIFIPADKVALKDAKKVDDVKKVPVPKKEEPVKEPVKEPAKETAKETDAKTVIHVVKKGDMLSKLAVQYKVPYIEIAKANNIKVNSILKIGQKLVIPMDKVRKPGAKTEPVKKAAAKAPEKTAAKTVKQPEAAPKKAETKAQPSASLPEKPVDADDIFGTDFDNPAAEAAPTAKPAVKPAAKPVAKSAPVVESWDIMVLKADKKVTVEEFARINGRSVASILALNPEITAGAELAEGTKVKIFIDPERQQ